MEYFICGNEDCKAVYFTDSFEGFKCTYCATGIVEISDDQAIEFFREFLAWNVDHPTVSC